MVRVLAGRLALVVGLVAAPGCSPPPLPIRGAPPVVRLEPAPRADGVLPVIRLHVTGLDLDASALVLFRGALDSYHAARLRSAALPSTLDALRVPSTAWSAPEPADSGATAKASRSTTELVLAPSEVLDQGETYTFGALGFGTLSTFVVSAEGNDYAVRVWPPPAAPRAGTRWVFCGTGAMPAPGGVVVFEPAAVSAVVGPGADSQGNAGDTCFHLDAVDQGGLASASDGGVVTPGVAIPPPLLGTLSLDPSPVTLDAPAIPFEPLLCDDPAVALGPACARVLDDRVFVRNPAAPLLWAFSAPTTQLVDASPGEEFMIGGLSPSAQVSLTGTVTDLAGREASFARRLTTASALPHLILNEALANPSGAEKTSEWVELVNDGPTSVELAGWSLGDSGTPKPLPRGSVPPGAYALVVPLGYDPAATADVAPATGTLLLRVPELGSDGLSNQGETLVLRDPDGAIVSEFPALAATKPGVSMARRAPTAADDDPTAFGPSAAPGASPGAPNVLDGP